MSIGYACLTIGVENAGFRSCMIKNADEEKLKELIAHNLKSLENIIDYNIRNNIKLFRISSDLIPFGSNSINDVPWWDIFESRLKDIGNKIIENSIRVSMHPGQYTVLNSPKEEVVKNAIDDLNYHAQVLESLGVDSRHKIILHIGGVYNDKFLASKRFICNYEKLNESVKKRLVIENDHKSYNIQDVLNIGKSQNIPVVFDSFHNQVNPSNNNKCNLYWIEQCEKTWNINDGKQKIHYSQQNPLKNIGSHSATIKINDFVDFYNSINGEQLDIMLEVKDKNLSAVKCINCISTEKNITFLENEWSKYKYSILEKSHADYLKIRKLLKNKDEYPVIEFYNILEHALQEPEKAGNAVNAAQHVWGYFKNTATKIEKETFIKSINAYEENRIQLSSIKNKLKKMAIKYDEKYLLSSYYFAIK